jgi:tRNA-Thr(GGU) m(6)t(6)A37 methyltransferase TsaA
MPYCFDPIGKIHSCFTEKFGIPRQPGLAPEARAVLELYPPYGGVEVLRELDGFSHLWILFVFHGNHRHRWTPTVRPPRLGANRRVGVFASRSPFRPNPIGISVVAIEGIRNAGMGSAIDLAGADLLDGTPVLDIKPYVPWADAIAGADGGYAHERPMERLAVDFLPAVEERIDRWERAGRPGLKRLIRSLIALDPRPSYRRTGQDARTCSMRLFDIDFQWEMRGKTSAVVTTAIRKTP